MLRKYIAHSICTFFVVALIAPFSYANDDKNNSGVDIDMSVIDALGDYFEDVKPTRDSPSLILLEKEEPVEALRQKAREQILQDITARPEKVQIKRQPKTVRQKMPVYPKRRPAFFVDKQQTKSSVANAVKTTKTFPTPGFKPRVPANFKGSGGTVRTYARKTKNVAYNPNKKNKDVKTEGFVMPAVPPETVVKQATMSDTDQSLSPLQKRLQSITTPITTPQQAEPTINITRPAIVKPSAESTELTIGDIESEHLLSIEPAGQLTKTAMKPRLPPAEEKLETEYVTLVFERGQSDLSAIALETLKNDIMTILKNKPDARVQIQAFASASRKEKNNDARRLSLSRALEVRKYLMDNGVNTSRMDVRALGMQTNKDPLDRVDVVFFNKDTSGTL